MPMLTITKTYVNGNTLFQADLDSAFNSITTFLNTTLIDNLNIQTGGIIGLNLANGTIGNAQLGSACVNTANIASSAITTALIGAGQVNTTNIASSAVGLAQLASNINFPKTTQIGSQNVAVSNTNATNSLGIIRGIINSNGSINTGEGFTVGKGVTGQYQITFSTNFSDSPAVVAQVITNSSTIPNSEVFSSLVSGFTINWQNSGTTNAIDVAFMFIAIGQRN